MQKKRQRQSSLNEFYQSSHSSEDEAFNEDDIDSQIRRLNLKLQTEVAFPTSRQTKTTVFSAEEPLSESILTWVRPPFSWCEVSKELCVQRGFFTSLLVRSDPFQQYKVEVSSDEVDIPDLHRRLFALTCFYQKQALKQIEPAPKHKLSQAVSAAFRKQLLNSTVKAANREE
jgi:hypothetical protein